MSALAATRRFLEMVKQQEASGAAAASAQPAAAATPQSEQAAMDLGVPLELNSGAAAAPNASALNASAGGEEDEDATGADGGGFVSGMSRADRRRLKKKRKQLDRGSTSLASVSSTISASAAAASAPGTSLEAIYGARGQAGLELKLNSYLVNGRTSLRSAELQQLLLWVLGDANLAESPRWCFVRNKPLVGQVLLLLLDGVTEAHFTAHRADYEKVFAPHFGTAAAPVPGAPQPQPVRLATAHSAFARASVLQDYLACPIVRDRVAEQQQARKKQRNNAGAAVADPAAAAAEEDEEAPPSPPQRTAEEEAALRASRIEECLLNEDEMRANLYPVPSKADAALFRRTCTPHECSLRRREQQSAAAAAAASSSDPDAADAAAATLTAEEIEAQEAADADPAKKPLLPTPAPPGPENWEDFPCVHVPVAAEANGTDSAASSESASKADAPAAPAVPTSGPSATASAAAASDDSAPPPPPRLFGLDCEMVYTSVGLELARLTLVDEQGATLLDELVRPARPIVDYNTRFSGLTPALLEGVTTTREEVRSRVAALVRASDVLVGHSLENDLRVLHLLHHRCMDTALLFSHPRGPPYKLALRALVSTHLAREIQTAGALGHDSAEDAVAALDLAKLKLQHGRRFGEPQRDREPIAAVLARVGRQASLIGHAAHVRDLANDEPRYHVTLAADDEAVVAAACKQLASGSVALVVAQLQAMRNVPPPPPAEVTDPASPPRPPPLLPHPHVAAVVALSAQLRRLAQAAKPNTLIIVASGQASTLQQPISGGAAASTSGPSGATPLEQSKQGLMWLTLTQQAQGKPSVQSGGLK